ncbi:hypothetical protein FRZ67_19690 [Panacibacter ginsenosidivorans]|uniref:Uncharacterized protein n=1 Tax=Panacibacter ginsenosidivorans TaxID=1813871 RepID=A0A5B8VEE2_9BACT|nr:hypothetical protein [Panacibacter ginsenosidivorans]QEC69415.1 hypothetical protein FRZ67_19690 [Panacibacter ginsenosidivorans]
MRRFLLFIIILSHINTTMFVPCVDEVDEYNKDGTVKDDINSVAEYVYQVVLKHKDKTPEDEDDDQAHYFLLAKSNSFNFQQDQYKILPTQFSLAIKKEYPVLDIKNLPVTYLDILTPPPDIAS